MLDRALDALIGGLEKRKFAATTKPRQRRGAVARARHVPAHVRRAVWARDRGQCTFVSETGHRCSARRLLEFDHVDPVARGGRATAERMRLRCRAHNQYEAERAFGAGFMSEKREQGRRVAAEERARSTQAEQRVASGERARSAQAETCAWVSAQELTRDVLAGLHGLGIRGEEARRAAEASEAIPDATLEERMRAALRSLRPKTTQVGRSQT